MPYIGHKVVRVPGLSLRSHYTPRSLLAQRESSFGGTLTSQELGEFVYAPSDEANPYRSRPVVDSAVECTLDIPPEPVDPDREHLRTLPISLSEFDFLTAGPLDVGPVEYTSYTPLACLLAVCP